MLSQPVGPHLPHQAPPPQAPPPPPPIVAGVVDPRPLLEKDLNCLSETPALLAANTQTFCDDQSVLADKERMLLRRQEINKANQEKQARLNSLCSLLPATRQLPPSQALKTRIGIAASKLSHQVQTLKEGESLVFAGSYGEKSSLADTFLPLGRLLLSRNSHALPLSLREAFQRGVPTKETVIHALFAIVEEKGERWPEDPVAQRILRLILPVSDAQSRNALIQSINRISPLPPKTHLSALLEVYPEMEVIPSDFGRDDLLKALLPTENNMLYSLMQSLVSPKIAAHFANPETAPTTIEALITLLLNETYEHGSQQLSAGQKSVLAETLETVAAKWNAIDHLNRLKQKQLEGTGNLVAELGHMLLKLSGEKQTDFSHFLLACMNDTLESTCKELLNTLSPDTSALLEGSLLSPTGDYFIKCIRRGHKTYDVEVYASGPMLHLPPFAGKWPISFSHLPVTCLNHHFFKGLIQHTLSEQEQSPFSSSPEYFKQFLLAALGQPHVTQPTSHLPNSTRLSSTELTFHYLSHNPDAHPQQAQNPALNRLLWQYGKLQHVITTHTRDGTLDFGTPDQAKAVQSAAMRLFNSAEGLKSAFPVLSASLQRIQTTCQNTKAACVETQQRRIRESFARDGGVPIAFHLPHALKIPLQPSVAKLRATIAKIERICQGLPFASSFLQASHSILLQKIFSLSEADALHLYTLLDTEFPALPSTPTPGIPALRSPSRTLFALHKIVNGVKWTLHTLFKLLSACASFLFAHLPQSFQNALTRIAQKVQQRVIEKIVDLLIERYFDAKNLHALVAFGSKFIESMHTHPPLSFNVPQGMIDGQYSALEFGAQLLPLRGFASLEPIQVTVAGGIITSLTLGPAGVFRLTEQGRFTHETHGTLCLQQHAPKLAALQPYLLVEDRGGNQRVLLRESMITNQAADFFAEQSLGTFLWNGVKQVVPPAIKPNALYSCTLTDTHLSAPLPEAMLYITRSYLIHEQPESALAAYHEYERHVQENPDFTITLAHILPFLLCSHAMAPKIRLSLYAQLEQQRKRFPDQPLHPLEGFLWVLICADFHQVHQTFDDPEFPHLHKQIPYLAQVMVQKMEEQLPFYTTQELAECIKQLLRLKGEVSGDDLKTLLGSAHLKPEHIRLAAPYLIPPAIGKIGASSTFSTFKKALKESINMTLPELSYAGKGLTFLFNKADVPKKLPALMRQLVQHKELTKREEEDLRNAFAHVLPCEAIMEADHLLDTSSLPPLSAQSLKSHFWSYYALLYHESQHQTAAAHSIKLPLILLQQELGFDREAAVLARILLFLLSVVQEKRGSTLKKLDANPDAFSPFTLQQLLQEEGIAVLTTRFQTLMTEPQTLLPGMAKIKTAIQIALKCTVGSAGLTMKAATCVTKDLPQGIRHRTHKAIQGVQQVGHSVKDSVQQVGYSVKDSVQQAGNYVKDGVTHKTAQGISWVTQGLLSVSNVFIPQVRYQEEAEDLAPQVEPDAID